MKKMLIGISLFIFLFTSSNIFAFGFRLYDQGAKAQGQAGAYTAEASDPTAVYYNPAAITQFEGWNTYVGADFVILETEYTSLTGVELDSDNNLGVLPQFYVTKDINEHVALGLGINSLYGLSTDYGETGSLRYVATFSELITVNFSPVIAYQVNQQLSVAAGLDVLIGSADLRRNIDFGALAGAPGTADGKLILEGDGAGVGFNLALHYNPHEQHAFGVTYRSAIDLDLDGSSNINTIPAFIGVGSTVTGDLDATIELPSVVRFGYAYWPKPEWKVEFVFDWTDWSRFEKITFESSGNPLFPTTDLIRNYTDTYLFGLGTSYDLNEIWTVRCGYVFVDQAVPDEAFDPIVPDSDRHLFAVGASYRTGNITIDIAYQLVLFDDRDIGNAVGADIGATVNGEYESIVNAVSIGVHWEI